MKKKNKNEWNVIKCLLFYHNEGKDEHRLHGGSQMALFSPHVHSSIMETNQEPYKYFPTIDTKLSPKQKAQSITLVFIKLVLPLLWSRDTETDGLCKSHQQRLSPFCCGIVPVHWYLSRQILQARHLWYGNMAGGGGVCSVRKISLKNTTAMLHMFILESY